MDLEHILLICEIAIASHIKGESYSKTRNTWKTTRFWFHLLLPCSIACFGQFDQKRRGLLIWLWSMKRRWPGSSLHIYYWIFEMISMLWLNSIQLLTLIWSLMAWLEGGLVGTGGGDLKNIPSPIIIHGYLTFINPTNQPTWIRCGLVRRESMVEVRWERIWNLISSFLFLFHLLLILLPPLTISFNWSLVTNPQHISDSSN